MEMKKMNIDHMQTVQSRIVALQDVVDKQSLQMLSWMILIYNKHNQSQNWFETIKIHSGHTNKKQNW